MKSASSPCLVLLWFFILSSHQHQSHNPHTKPYNSSKSTWKSSVKFQYLNFYSQGQISLQEICPRINYRWYLTWYKEQHCSHILYVSTSQKVNSTKSVFHPVEFKVISPKLAFGNRYNFKHQKNVKIILKILSLLSVILQMLKLHPSHNQHIQISLKVHQETVKIIFKNLTLNI